MPVYQALALCLVVMFAAMPAHAESPVSTYTPPPPREWSYVSDQVMGGISQGRAQIMTGDGRTYLRLTGDVSTANNGGFIQTRVKLDQRPPAQAQGVVIRARGNGARYFVHLRTTGTILPWQYYQASFDTTDAWQDIRIPFSAFKPSGRLLRATPRARSVTSVGFVAFGHDHAADLSAEWVGLY